MDGHSDFQHRITDDGNLIINSEDIFTVSNDKLEYLGDGRTLINIGEPIAMYDGDGYHDMIILTREGKVLRFTPEYSDGLTLPIEGIRYIFSAGYYYFAIDTDDNLMLIYYSEENIYCREQERIIRDVLFMTTIEGVRSVRVFPDESRGPSYIMEITKDDGIVEEHVAHNLVIDLHDRLEEEKEAIESHFYLLNLMNY